MKINYKEPYWAKFQWEMESHHENQYVTEFNKLPNETFKSFQYNDNYIITVNFSIKPNFKTDEFCMIFGKPGKNMGLTYKQENGNLAFEFWTKGSEDDAFNYMACHNVEKSEIENEGVTISIVRDGQKFIAYNDFEKCNIFSFNNNLIDDYGQSGLFLGCSNPGTYVPEHRYYGEMEINHFSIITNSSDIDLAKDLYKTEPENLVGKPYYNDILCLYDFKTQNNIDIFYDESKNSNFLEKVPKLFIIP
jgi:hypothetical protein